MVHGNRKLGGKKTATKYALNTQVSNNLALVLEIYKIKGKKDSLHPINLVNFHLCPIHLKCCQLF